MKCRLHTNDWDDHASYEKIHRQHTANKRSVQSTISDMRRKCYLENRTLINWLARQVKNDPRAKQMISDFTYNGYLTAEQITTATQLKSN